MTGLVKYFVLGFIVGFLPASIIIFSSNNSEVEVLSSNIEIATPTESPTPFPTERPTPRPTRKSTPTPSPTESPSPTPTPAPPITSQEINGFVDRFAGQYNVDPNVLRHIAICESGFNPNAVNGAYVGLFQFGPITWMTNRVLIGENPNPALRYDAEESVQTAAYMLSTRGGKFWPNCIPDGY